MPSPRTGLQFDLEWRITLFTVVMVPLMASLGFWQLQRADEKAALATSFAVRQTQHPAPPAQLWEKPADSLAYVPVLLAGMFLQDEYFLLDNKIHSGRFGYEVIGILLLDGGGTVLVNRGWIAGDASRRELPVVPGVTGPVSLTGHVYVAPGEPYLLAQQTLETGWPKRIQAIEMDKLLQPVKSSAGHDRVFPFPVRIDAGVPGALMVDWKVVNISPQKHHGYAVQWFAMAAVLFIFYLLRCSNLWQLLTASGRK
jgi:cytochrome oxidase assembly protein ShyY1